MYSSYRLTTGGTIILTGILLLVQSHTAIGYPHDQSLHSNNEPGPFQKREGVADQDQNSQNLYGRGVRLGSYLQAFAYIFGFFTPWDPKSQISGIILAIQLLLPWWISLDQHAVSISELGIGQAQILLITTPGAILLFLSLSYTRRYGKTKDGRQMMRKEVIRGEVFNFLQVFIVLAWANVTNFWFTGIILSDFKWAPETARDSNPIWMWRTLQVGSPGFKTLITVQFVLTFLCEAVPYVTYVIAWFRHIRELGKGNFYQAYREIGWGKYDCVQQRTEKKQNIRLWLDKKGLIEVVTAILAAFYVGILIVSIENTIDAANLSPATNLLDPGQLVPLLTGILAFISAIITPFVCRDPRLGSNDH